jgi:hypothetical protein
MGYEYEQSIDQDTFNMVKLITDSKDVLKRVQQLSADIENVQKWGQLQYFDTVSEKLNAAQLKARADQILKSKNRIGKSLKLSCLGDIRLKAGNSVFLSIAELKKEVPFNKAVLITSASHKFSNGMHTCDITLEVY